VATGTFNYGTANDGMFWASVVPAIKVLFQPRVATTSGCVRWVKVTVTPILDGGTKCLQ